MQTTLRSLFSKTVFSECAVSNMLRDQFASAHKVASVTRGFRAVAVRSLTVSMSSSTRCMSQTATRPASLAQTGRVSQAASGLSVSLVLRRLSIRLTAGPRHNCSITRRPRLRTKRSLPVLASSARADEPSLVRQSRPSWNYKLGAVYQHFLPGPLLFLPSLLQPISTIISLEGALHGHEWVHWLLSLLPVPQVQPRVAYLCLLMSIRHYSMT